MDLSSTSYSIPADKEFFSVREAASLARMSTGRIYQNIQSGTIRTVSDQELLLHGVDMESFRAISRPSNRPHHVISREALIEYLGKPRPVYRSPDTIYA